MADKITRELQCAGIHRSVLPEDPVLEQILAQLKTQPNERSLLERAGIRLMELQLYREAGEYFSMLLSLFPFYGPAFLKRGFCHLVCWRYEEAASDLEVGVHHFPENWHAWFELGVSYMLGRNYDRAASIFAFACSALTGIGDCVPNKQRCLWLPKTLLATIHPSKKFSPSDVTFPFKTALRYQLW